MSDERANWAMESFTFAQPMRISTLHAYASDEQTVSPMSSFPPIPIPSRRGSASNSSPSSSDQELLSFLRDDGQRGSCKSCGPTTTTTSFEDDDQEAVGLMTTEQCIVLERHFSDSRKPSTSERQALAQATGLPVHHIAVSVSSLLIPTLVPLHPPPTPRMYPIPLSLKLLRSPPLLRLLSSVL
ncbi:hypothetical protein BZA05DRAFT_213911 [Tricharina praecox]|uniref:uncharacterized protein n=1 Tax=Tricharina praecox TaxID=43433 RepID=UPI00222112D8|nr:uncharacterized protein BZA05DRAFT_213911 [Tricharina praecox]KAI5855643.1 hypothetical protein BZA05DRAFT_213911 [Tricharina praecox]